MEEVVVPREETDGVVNGCMLDEWGLREFIDWTAFHRAAQLGDCP